MLKRLLPMSAAILLLNLSFGLVEAGDVSCDECSSACGTCCEKVCVTHAKPGKESRYCWEVECKEVCIPAVRFPWECCKKNGCDSCCADCRVPKCGRVRCVRKLKLVEYECDVCEYEHEIVCCCNGSGCDGCAACCPSHYQPISAKQPAAKPAADIAPKSKWLSLTAFRFRPRSSD